MHSLLVLPEERRAEKEKQIQSGSVWCGAQSSFLGNVSDFNGFSPGAKWDDWMCVMHPATVTDSCSSWMEKEDYFRLNECPLKFNSLRDRQKIEKRCVLRVSHFRLLKSVQVLLSLNLIYVGSLGVVCCSTGSFPRLRPSVTGSFYESLFKDETY